MSVILGGIGFALSGIVALLFSGRPTQCLATVMTMSVSSPSVRVGSVFSAMLTVTRPDLGQKACAVIELTLSTSTFG